MKRFTLFFALLCALCASAVPSPASAQTVPQEILQRARNHVRDFGAKGDGTTDDTAAIQRAIDGLRNGGEVYLDPGKTYRITDTLKLTVGDGTYKTIALRGDGGYAKGSGPGSVRIVADFKDRPAISIQGARSVYLCGIEIEGQNTAPDALLDPDSDGNFDETQLTDDPADWIAADCTNGQYNPYAGIAIDPYSGVAPGTPYPNDAYGRLFSSVITIERCTIRKFVVGIAFKPSNDQNNADLTNVRDCFISRCAYGVSIGHTQAKGVTFHGCSVSSCMTAYEGATHGQQSGHPIAINGGNINQCYAAFRFKGDVGPLAAHGLFTESLQTLGYLGIGTATSSRPCTFTGCSFGTHNASGTQDANDHPIDLYAFVPVTFNGCTLRKSNGVWNIVGGQNEVNFVNCSWLDTSNNWTDIFYVAHNDAWGAPRVSISGSYCRTGSFNSGAGMNGLNTDSRVQSLPSRVDMSPHTRFIYGPTKSYQTIGFSGATSRTRVSASASGYSWAGSTLTFTASDGTDFAVGDVLYWQTAANSYASNTQFTPAVLKVTAINSNTITASALCNVAKLNTSYNPSSVGIAYRPFAHTTPQIGDTTSGSPTVSSVATPSTFWKVGDFIAGEGIPAKTRITAVGASTLTLSKNATATGSKVHLYCDQVLEVGQNKRVTPADFGGASNGSADASAAILAALQANDHVHIPAGHTYRVDSTITLTAGQKITGEGKTSKIKLTDAFAGAAVEITSNCEIDAIGIEGNTAGATTGSIGIKVAGTGGADFRSRWKIRNVDIGYCEDGIQLNYCGAADIYSAFVHHASRAGLHYTGSQVNAVSVFGGEIWSNTKGVLIDQTSGSNNNFFGVTIEGNQQHGVHQASAAAVGNFQFIGCYFEDNDQATGTGADIRADNAMSPLTVRGCWFNATAYGIYLASAYHADIDSNWFQNCAQKPIYLSGTLARFVRVGGANRYSTGATPFSHATDDLGRGTQWDKRPWVQGAFGDNATDDTTALQAWLTANPGEARLPEGTFIVSGTLTVADNQQLIGEGWQKTVIKSASGFAGPVLQLSSKSTVRDLQVLGQNTATSTGIKSASGAANWLLERVQVTNFTDNITIDSTAHANTIRGCRVRSAITANIFVSGTASGLTIDSCEISAAPRGLLVSGQPAALKLINSYLVDHTDAAVDMTNSVLAPVIQGNYFGNNGTVDIRGNAIIRSANIRGNYFITTPTSISTNQARGWVIGGNTFNPGGGTPKSISLTNSAVQRVEIGANVYVTGAFSYATDNLSVTTSYLGKIYGTAAPASGTWEAGEVVWNLDPDSTEPSNWLCGTGGSPGTWLPGPAIP